MLCNGQLPRIIDEHGVYWWPSTIPAFVWTLMTTTSSDPQGGLLTKENCKNILDTQYDALHGLLLSLAGELQTDRYWATGIHADPEFIHEAFQRHILNFLINHKDSPFMDSPTRDRHRIAQQTISSVRLTGSQKESHTMSRREPHLLPPPSSVSTYYANFLCIHPHANHQSWN